MEAYMENLTKKTTILLQPELHRRLTRLAEQRGSSLGELIRTACERQYGLGGSEERLRAARALAELSLPVGSPGQMKRESVPRPEEILG
jgi:predicted DNA-binding protein